MSTQVEFSVTAPKALPEPRSATFTALDPDTIEEAISMWGPEVCLDKLLGQITVERQAIARIRMTKTSDPSDENFVSDEDIQSELNEWKPRLAGPKKTKAEKVKAFFADMTPEERKALLRELRNEAA